MEIATEILAEGLQFPEAPIAMADGSIILVEIARGTLSRVRDGRIDVIAEPGGGPNGAAMGPDGAVYLCNNGGRFQFLDMGGLSIPGPRPATHEGGSIQRISLATGAVETLYEACEGRRLHAPNDLVFDRTGGFWFTDHGTGAHDGGLFYARTDGSSITCWKDNQASPNGVGLSPDETIVYFANTRPAMVWAFELAAPGILADHPGAAEEPLAQGPEGCLFDSLAVEAGGRLCVATLMNGGITVCDPDGELEHLPFPDVMTTNICFGGADMRDATLTFSATGKLARVRWPRPGLRLNFQQITSIA